MSFRKDEEKEKREKMVLISGTVMILVTALIGTQFIVEGRIFKDKIKSLENRGYDLNNTLNWDEYENWKQSEILDKVKGKYKAEVMQYSTWQDWKDQLKGAENAPIYDDSMWGPIFCCNQTYTIWFNTIDSRRMDGIGVVTTHYVLPDLVPENSEG